MKLSISLGPQLLFVACCLLDSAQASAKCAADNCERAMWPTASPIQLSSASAFCATFTQQVITATTGFPTRASAACGTNPSRYTSVCSCSPTQTTPTPTPSCPGDGIVKNGGFECGIAPWIAAAVTGTTFAVTEPGASGNFAFEVDQVIPPDTSTGLEQASINQNLDLVVGSAYTLTFSSWFNNGDAGFIGVKFDQQPVYTVDARDKNGPLVWNSNSLAFIATTAVFNLRLEFLFGAEAVMKADNVQVTPA